MRATISDMGPELLSRILGLTAAQEGVLNIVFRIADDKGLLLIDLKDLRILLNYVAEHKDDYLTTYGSISRQSVGGILRALLPLENQGGDLFSENRIWIFMTGCVRMCTAKVLSMC